jgi:uncharacterized SAM-binding protein YcdF (DUF218 family)
VIDPTPTPVAGVPLVVSVPPRRRFRRLRRAVIAAAVVMVVMAGYLVVTWYQVRSTGRTDQARPVDAIVVMGAAQFDGRPAPVLAARLDHVVALWGEGLAPRVVVTGGNQPGDRFTEAEASRAYLVDRGIPETAILAENTGRNSYDSLVGVRDVLAPLGLRSVLIVTDPYHSLRVRLVAEELGLVAYVSATRSSPIQGRAELQRELREAAGVALGRIIGFRRLLAITG